MSVWPFLVALSLLLNSQLVASQIGPVQFNAQQTFQSVQWTWKDLTLVADGDKSIKRGEGLEVTYTAAATATSTSVAQIAGTITVTPTMDSPSGGACNTFNSATKLLSQLRITMDGMPPVDIASGQTCNPSCTVNIPVTPITGTTVPTSLRVAALWGAGAAEDSGCPSQSFDIVWGQPRGTGDSAQVSQQITQPAWESMRIGNWLTQIPTMTTQLVSGNPLPSTGTSTGASINIPTGTTGDFSWSATWKISITDIFFCINTAQQISNVLTLKPVSRSNNNNDNNAGGTLTADATVNIIVQGCDEPVSLTINDIFLRTQVTFQWSHSLQATGATQQMVPWGGTAIFPARAQFQRTVTSAIFNLRMNIQVVNPENGPVWVQALQIQCPWTQTIIVQCGVNTVGINNGGGTGTGFVVPAKGTFNCPVNEQVPGIWGADMTQTCTVYTQTFWSIVTQQTNLILNFNAPREWVRINDCVNWQMQCTPATGNQYWRPQVSGGPQGGNFGGGLKICGNDYTSDIPDQEANIAMGGNWVGDGSQPGACTSSVTSSCTSSISMVNTGATSQANSGGGTGTSLQVSATPTNCAVPPPSPSPPPPPPPDMGPGFRGNDRMIPVITVSVTNTYIEGTFGWTVAASVSPAAQAIVLGSTGVGRYSVAVTRGNANDAQPVRYIIEGKITLENTFDKVIPLSSVNAVLGAAKVAASCPELQAGVGPGQTMTCTYKVLYSMGPTPGSMDAEVVFPDTSTTAAARTQAPFSFDRADVTQAVGSCGFVRMSFAANEGMALTKTRDAGAAVLRVDGQAVRVCASTTFEFDVSYSPNLPLSCGFQPVIGTAVVYPDVPEQQPIRQAAAAANITVTCAGSLMDTPSPSGTPAGDGPAPAPPAAPGGVTVVLGQVASKPVQNVEWTLKLTPEALGGKVSKAPGESVAVNFTALYTKSVETMTGYSGEVTIQNNADVPLQVDGVVLELTDSQQQTVAQVAGTCAVVQVSSASPLVVPARGSTTCTYELKAKSGGTVQATVTALNVEDAIQSAPQAVQSLMDVGASAGCANLVTGLGATTLVPDGRLLADGLTDRPEVTEVCSTGMTAVKYTIPATEAPCATYPFLATAVIVPELGTTATPVTASATVEVELTGCPAVSPPTATLNLVRSYKARIMQWGISQQLVEPLPDNTLVYTEDGNNSVNVTLLFNRTQLPGTKVSVSGTATVAAGNTDRPVVGKSRLLVLPLCAADICNAIFVTPSCDPTLSAGQFSCKFQADRLPVASGIVLPLFYSSVDQAWPHLAKAVVYDPTTSSGRRTLGRCATLTDTQQLFGGPMDAAPASVTKANEVNPLPQEPVCASSFLNTYSLKFAGVSCADSPVPYDFTSQAKATPSDSATSVTSASLSFQVKC